MRPLRQPIHQRRPIAKAIVGNALQTDMRSRSQQPLLQVLTKSVVDRERYDERRHPRRHPSNGNSGDDTNKRLPPFGAQVAGRDEKFKAHAEAFSRQLSAFSYDYGLYGASR